MQRVVLRHISGSRAGQVDEFALDDFREALIGRSPVAAVRYEPDQDDLVGREHARLVRDADDPDRFTIVDLDSRNGVYLNKQRVLGGATVLPGDVLQLGPGGPEFEFTIGEPPPQPVGPEEAREETGPISGPPPAAEDEGAAGGPGITEGDDRPMFASSSRIPTGSRAIWIALLVLVAVGIAVGAVVYLRSDAGRPAAARGEDSGNKTRPMSAVDRARAYSDAVVSVDVTWNLVVSGTGRQVYHEYYVDREGQAQAGAQGGLAIPPVPVFIRLPDGRIEPSLTTEPGAFNENQRIGGRQSGSGFVMTPDGFILTSGEVAVPWKTSYAGFPESPGLLFELGSKRVGRLERPPTDWVATAARQLERRLLPRGTVLEVRVDAIDVKVGGGRVQGSAKLVGDSDAHGAALLYAEFPQPLKVVQVSQAADLTTLDREVVVLGYPAGTAIPTATTGSLDPATNGIQFVLAPGVPRGFSGSPAFDGRGQVIGILQSGQPGAETASVIPIRHGLELLQAAQKR